MCATSDRTTVLIWHLLFVGKVRCDGNQPCSRCDAASWECTYLKTHGKSGPKGPRRTTETAIKRLQERSKSSHDESRSNSEASFDAGSPRTAEVPYQGPIPSVNHPDVDIAGWPDTTTSMISANHKEHQRITTSCISQYLDIYHARGYGIWPVVETEMLTVRLLAHSEDLEAYALAAAICAAIVSQFSLETEPGSPLEDHYRVPSSAFEAESKKARNESDHLENVTVFSLLSTFFLHVHAANIGRMNASTVLLGEAIFKAHILGMHKPVHYQHMNAEQTQYALRIYWLLFITERAHSLQHDVPTTLKRSPDLPKLEDLHDGSVTPAFIQLCRLFSILDSTITAYPATARHALASAQQQLSSDEDPRSLENELQRADITMTQQWMRIFLWQHALNVTNLSSRANQDEEFSFHFPAKVAQNVLSNLSSLSRQSVEAHGPGMVRLAHLYMESKSLLTFAQESKLFDVANSLADVMLIMPSMNRPSHFDVGPRDLIHSLSQVLASFRGGNSAVISILQDKLTTLGLGVSSPQKLLELSSPEEEHKEWHDRSLLAPSSCRLVTDEQTISPTFRSSMSEEGANPHTHI
jgi:hypothetical protein